MESSPRAGKLPNSHRLILKNKLECDRCNFRPIFVLPVLSKIIELDENNLIYSRYSGFRRKHSTETALINIIDELLFNLDKDRVSGMVLVRIIARRSTWLFTNFY